MGYWFLIRLLFSYPCSPGCNTSLHGNLHILNHFCFFSPLPVFIITRHPLSFSLNQHCLYLCIHFYHLAVSPLKGRCQHLTWHHALSGVNFKQCCTRVADYSNCNAVVHCTRYPWQRRAALPMQFPGGERLRGWDRPKPVSRCGGKRVTEQCGCPLLT